MITSAEGIVLRMYAISSQGYVWESVHGDIMETTVIKAAVSTVLMDFVINLQVIPRDISVFTVHILFSFSKKRDCVTVISHRLFLTKIYEAERF